MFMGKKKAFSNASSDYNNFIPTSISSISVLHFHPLPHLFWTYSKTSMQL